MTLRNESGATGFTLIEALVVVVILAILTIAVAPQFSAAQRDAKQHSFRFNLQTLRSEIKRYKSQHLGIAPDGTKDLKQLVSATDINGNLGTAGPAFPYGPYLSGSVIPANPNNGSTKVTLFREPGQPTARNSPDAAWIYRPSTGELWADDPQVINE